MKKLLPLIILTLITVVTAAQNSAPNGNFENWFSDTYEYPQNYPFTSNPEAFFRFLMPFNLLRTTDSYHGTYAIELRTLATDTDTSAAYVVNSINTDGPVWHGGVPYKETPKGIRGYYKYNVASQDAGYIVVAFSKAGTNIGMYFFEIGGIHDTYTLFDFTFDPALTIEPDSVIFGATSSNFLTSEFLPGSTLLLDSVSFTGVTSQPELLSGDFEVWQSETLSRLTNWYTERDGMNRTIDSYAGDYAAELTTYPGSDDGTPVARAGQLSTGYYSNACDCMKGGYPYSNQSDALIFYYKYEPVNVTDNAEINIQFKKNGTFIDGRFESLTASSSYKYVRIPYNLVQAPDSVVIEIRSSSWTNKDLSFAGAVLKIDEIYFESQIPSTGIESNFSNKNFNIFPNPTDGKFAVQYTGETLPPANGKIEVYNSAGQKILKSEIKERNTDFDISAMPEGLYFVKIYDGQLIHTAKIVKQ